MILNKKMKRVIFFVDGFNLYHSLIDSKLKNRLSVYKWLNLKHLAELFMQKDDCLVDIYYFSAICSWDIHKANRHKIYIQALKNENIKVVLGKFKQIERKCRAVCLEKYVTFEEKRTDVNIAVHLVSDAPQYDIAYLISADSDLIPAIEKVNELYPEKQIKVIVPMGKEAFELIKVCHGKMKIKEHHLATSQFEKTITLKNGITIYCPKEW